MKNSLKLITIKDIHIYVHWTFLLLIAWLLIANITTGIQVTGVVWSLFFIGGVLASLLLHELAHAYMASKFGITARHIILLPIGGIASIEKLPDTPTQEMIISAVGPIANILIAMMLSMFIQSDVTFGNFIGFNTVINAGNTLYSLYIVNIVLAALNIIPAYPFDGGRMMRAFLGIRYNYIRANTIESRIGRVVAGVLIITGAFLLNSLPDLRGVFIILTGLFIVFFSGTEENYLRLKALFKGLKLKDTIMYGYNSLEANLTVNEAAAILDSNYSKHFIVMDGPEPVGTINRFEIVKAMAEMKYDSTVQELMKNEELKFYSAETEVDELLDELAVDDERIFLVRNGHFSGVVNFQHIVEYLLIQKARSEDYGRMRSLVGLLND